MMGNQPSSNHKNKVTVVKAAGKFKHKLMKKDTSVDDVDDVIRCVVNSYFRKKNDVLESHSDGGSGEDKEQPDLIFKYIQRNKVGDASRDCNISDTRVAWNALRMSARQEQDGGRNEVSRFKKLSAAIRFARRVNPTTATLQYESNEPLEPWETSCHFCEDVRNQLLLPCRLCTKVYHAECLGRRGHLSSDLQKEALDLAKTEIGWSCPSCESLFELLSDVEKIDLMEMFDVIDTNQDSLISREEYLEFCQKKYKELTGTDMASYRLQQENTTFDDMDRDGSGVVDWWEFLTPMCVNILMKKPKHQLVKMLIPREIRKIKRYFRSYDPLGEGHITSRDSRLAFKQWYISLINRPAFHIPLSEWLGDYRTEDDDVIQLITSSISWEQFLSGYAIFILAARPNTASTRPYLPRLDEVLQKHDHDYFTE